MKKRPKDLGVVIKSKKLLLWEKVRDMASRAIEQSEDEIEIQKELLKSAELKIAEEQQ